MGLAASSSLMTGLYKGLLWHPLSALLQSDDEGLFEKNDGGDGVFFVLV